MAEQEKLNSQPKPSKKKKEKEPLSPALKKAYTTWGIVTVVVSFAMFFASIITFVLVLLRLKVPFILGVVFFVAGVASGATGIPLLQATAREKAEQKSLNKTTAPMQESMPQEKTNLTEETNLKANLTEENKKESENNSENEKETEQKHDNKE